MRSDRFWLPQEMRNFWTSSSVLTACKISSFVSVPESSLSIMMKTSAAAFKSPRARELLVGGGGGALAPLALVGELREALLEAAVDRLLPCVRIKSRGGCK